MPAIKKKLGKQKFEASDHDLNFTALLDAPAGAGDWGHYDLVDGSLYDFEFPWGMLGNDKVGDCTIAGAAHSQELDDAEGGRPRPSFSDKVVLEDYSAVTGWDPKKPSTDTGAVVRDVLSYRRKTGLADSHGKRHRIGVFGSVPLSRIDAVGSVTGKVGIGFEVPRYAMSQFDNAEPFSLDPNADDTIEGGHFVVVVGKLIGNLVVVTWGTLALMTPQFADKYVDEAWAYATGAQIDPETDETLAGLDVEKARAYIADLEKESK